MHYKVIQQFARTLRNLDAVMAKAEQHAAARNFNADNFLASRLAPDMLPFAVQIRIATDSAKGTAAVLAGKAPLKFEDNEATFAELRARVSKCVLYLETFKAADYANVPGDKLVPAPYPPGKMIRTDEYFFARQIPNFYFHVTAAYALLRAGGVEIGKNDYLGQLELLDA